MNYKKVDEESEFDIFYNQNNILYKNYINNYLERLFGGSEKTNFLKVLPTIINVIKGRLIYSLKSKLPLIEIKNKNKLIKMGVIINISNVLNMKTKTKITKKEIMEYICSFQVVPLFFNDENKEEVFFNNKKKKFLGTTSELLFVVFKVKPELKLYICDIESKQYSKFISEEKIINENKNNFMVAHYIYDNFFMLNTDPKNTLTLLDIYRISEKKTLQKITEENIEPQFYKNKMSLENINEIITICIKTHLTKIKTQ